MLIIGLQLSMAFQTLLFFFVCERAFNERAFKTSSRTPQPLKAHAHNGLTMSTINYLFE